MTKYLARSAVAAALALSACGQETSRDAAPDVKVAETPVPEVTPPPVSILRPDVAPETSEARLQPLEAAISFADGGYVLSSDAEKALLAISRSEQLLAGWPVILRGHTDSVGADRDNLRVSRRRAEAVAEWLVSHGVEEDRISVIALGEQRPVAPNANLDGTADEEGRAKNRRVTVTIAPIEEAPEEMQAAS